MTFDNDINEVIKRMQEIMRPVVEMNARITESLEQILEVNKQVVKWFAPIVKQQEDFLKSIQRIESNRNDTRDVFLESGWWLTPSMMDMPADWITSAIVKYKKGNKKAIFDLFRRVYQNDDCTNLEALVSKWNSSPFIGKWSAHLSDALESHKQKKYNLSIPMLLIVAEGVAGEYCKKNNIGTNPNSGEDKIKKSLNEHNQKHNTIFQSNIDLLEGALSSVIYINTKKLKSSLRKKVLNRHAILHGLNSNYGSMKTSLQAFMLIDMLSELK